MNPPHSLPPSLRGIQVVLVSHGFQTNYERGFCNGLAANLAEATLISSDSSDYDHLDKRVTCVNLRGSQDEQRPKWAKALNLVAYHVKLWGYVVRHRPDVIHVIGLIEPAWLCGVLEGLWFRLWCRRYVLTVHDLLPHGRHTWRNKLLYGWSFQLAHRLVVHTRRMGEELTRRHGIEASRITVMEHGIEPMSTMAQMPDDRVGTGTLELLFFGNILHYKGIDILLDALRDFPIPFRLKVAGMCRDGALAQSLRQQMDAHPQHASIEWKNSYVAEEDIAALFMNTHALVLPYRHIDQSGVLFQALRWGSPIVASRVGAFEHYVTKDAGELCISESVEDLRAALLRLAQRRPELSRSRIIEFGRSFEWPRVVPCLQPAYQ